MEKTQYTIICSWQVIEKITERNEVWILDREKKSVILANELTMSEFAQIVSQDQSNERYEFWIEEKGEENNG